MKLKNVFVTLILCLLSVAFVSAQVRHPKREFRGAWIQCVNGQFQGMPVQTM